MYQQPVTSRVGGLYLITNELQFYQNVLDFQDGVHILIHTLEIKILSMAQWQLKSRRRRILSCLENLQNLKKTILTLLPIVVLW